MLVRRQRRPRRGPRRPWRALVGQQQPGQAARQQVGPLDHTDTGERRRARPHVLMPFCAPLGSRPGQATRREEQRQWLAGHAFPRLGSLFRRLPLPPPSGSTPPRRSPPTAPEHEGDVLTKSALFLQAPLPHPQLASPPSKNLVVFVPAQNNAPHRPLKPHERSVRDPKIPIGRARPNSALFLRGFRTPAPRLQRAGVRNPPGSQPPIVGLGELRFVRQGELPANLVSGRIL